MSSIEITDQNFKQIYQENDIVILDFWATWCGPCQQFGPIFEETSDGHNDIVFGKIETEAQPKLSSYFGIRSIPTILAIRDQIEVFRHSGLVSKDQLENVIAEIKNLDMDEVHKKISEEEN